MKNSGNKKGMVIWITGLSGSGKTTLSNELLLLLKRKKNAVLSLDGDKLREVINIDNENYDKASRLQIAQRYSKLCNIIANQGIIVLVSTISMFKEIYRLNRDIFPDYFEIYLDTPISELKRRDSKHIYSRFEAGELKNVAGLDIEVDEPVFADLVIKYDRNVTPANTANKIFSFLVEKKRI